MIAFKLLLASAVCATVASAATLGSTVAGTNYTLMVAMTNQYRSAVIPTAADMLAVQWHAKLGQMAQAHALSCNWSHYDPLAMGKQAGFYAVGETMYAIGALGSTNAQRNAISTWNNEKTRFTYPSTGVPSYLSVGHYLQQVWAKTQYMGCGVASCPRLLNNKMGYGTFVVCNYAIGGPSGGPPYTSGAKCSRCPSTARNCNPSVGLCYSTAAPLIKTVDEALSQDEADPIVTVDEPMIMPGDDQSSTGAAAAAAGGVAGVVGLVALVAGIVVYRRRKVDTKVSLPLTDEYVRQ